MKSASRFSRGRMLGIAIAGATTFDLAACRFPRASGDSGPPDLSRDSTEIAVLTYNVKALPFPLGGWSKGARMRRIGARFGDYDLVLVQEAFTSVADLFSAQTSRGTFVSERVGPARTGDRLTRTTGLALGVFAPLGLAPERHIGHYGICSGSFTLANDCLVSKGFILQRVRVHGAEVDVYDTHLDADERDQPTRDRQLAILASEIRRLSGDRALIVGGDFNIERTDDAQHRSLVAFASDLGLTDSGAIPSKSWPERIDYIFFRGSSAVSIDLVRAGHDAAFRFGDAEASDHPAMYAILRITGRTVPPTPSPSR